MQEKEKTQRQNQTIKHTNNHQTIAISKKGHKISDTKNTYNKKIQIYIYILTRYKER